MAESAGLRVVVRPRHDPRLGGDESDNGAIVRLMTDSLTAHGFGSDAILDRARKDVTQGGGYTSADGGAFWVAVLVCDAAAARLAPSGDAQPPHHEGGSGVATMCSQCKARRTTADTAASTTGKDETVTNSEGSDASGGAAGAGAGAGAGADGGSARHDGREPGCGSVVGCVAVRSISPHHDGYVAGVASAELKRMYVDPRVHRRGIATALLHQAQSFSRRLGYQRLWIETSRRFKAAPKFYAHHGFALIGSLDNDWEDNLMEVWLSKDAQAQHRAREVDTAPST